MRKVLRRIQNEAYIIELLKTGDFKLSGKECCCVFKPRFTIISRDDFPDLRYDLADEYVRYKVPSWAVKGFSSDNSRDIYGNEFQNLEKACEGRVSDIFEAGGNTSVILLPVNVEEKQLAWNYNSERFSIDMRVSLPEGIGEPEIVWNFTPHVKAWYTVGFTGAPTIEKNEITSIWQPIVWHDLRFPHKAYLTPEYNCTLPTVFVEWDRQCLGIIADPSEMPFRLPTGINSRFGVSVHGRDVDGNSAAQAMIFAPLYGGEKSLMEPGEKSAFKARIILRKGEWEEAFVYAAENIYNFNDYRENTTVNLNKTFENEINYALYDRYNRWKPEFKGNAYESDVPGAVNNSYSAGPLAVAVITDNQEIFDRRAMPIMEYLVSRPSGITATNPDVKGAVYSMSGGPVVKIPEMEVLNSYTEDENQLFKTLAIEKAKNNRWYDCISLYRMTGDSKYMDRAKEGADDYISELICNPMTPFEPNVGYSNWYSLTIRWIELFELYETTGDEKYLKAAEKGALKFCSCLWMCPAIPKGSITVNIGGKASKYWYARGAEPMDAPEEEVPAWIVSDIALHSEYTSTCHGHRGVFMTNFAPYMLRLAFLTQNNFLRAAARSAVIGRYENFPGYHINTTYSTVYMKYNYPYHDFHELTYNTFHDNHIWPHITHLLDFLVSDTYVSSNAKIDFPSLFLSGYAYFYDKVYGHKPGKFYDENNVFLWMPQGLLTFSDVQVNYISARGNGKIYFAVTNQSERKIKTKAIFDASRLEGNINGNKKYRLWVENSFMGEFEMEGTALELEVEPKGITGVAIEGISARTVFQNKIFNRRGKPLNYESINVYESAFGPVNGMITTFGKGLTNAYIYLESGAEVIEKAILHYKKDGVWKREEDTLFPFEFTINVDDNASCFEYYVEAVLQGSRSIKKTEIIQLKL